MSDNIVEVRIEGDASPLAAASAKAEGALKTLSQAVQGTTAGLAPLNGVAAQTINQFDRAAATLSKTQHAFQAVTDALEANEISAQQAARSYQLIGQQAEAAAQKAGGATGQLSGLTAGATREYVVLGHEVMSGNFSRIPGSLVVLAERSGNLHGIVSALASPFGLVAAAVGITAAAFVGLVAHEEEAQRTSIAVQTAFASAGNSGRMTAAEVKALTQAISELHGVNSEAATEIITDFARTRQIGGQLFSQLVQDIDQSARAMGVEAPEAAKKLAAAFADPAQGARQLHDTYGILDSAQLNQIQTLQRYGDLVGAQNILLAAWKGRLAELPPGLTKVQTEANKLANAWQNLMRGLGETSTVSVLTKAWDGFLFGLSKVVQFVTPLSAVEQAQSRVAYLQKELDHDLAKNPGGEAYQAHLTKLKADLDAAKTALEQAQQAGKSTAGGGGATAAPGGNNAAAMEEAADAAAKRHVGTQTQLNDLMTDEIAINEQITAQAQKIADLDKAGKTGTDEYRAQVAQLDRLQDSLKKIAEEKAELVKQPDNSATQLQTWRTELAQQKAAADLSRKEELQADLAFWDSKRANLTQGSRDMVEVSREIATSQIALNKEVASEAKAAAKDRLAAEKDAANTEVELGRISLNAERARLDALVSAGRMSADQRLEAERNLAAEEYKIGLDSLAAARDQYKEGTLAWQQEQGKMEILTANFTNQLDRYAEQAEAAHEKAAKETSQAWDKALAPTERAFDSMVTGVLQGTQTIEQAADRAAANLVLSEVEADVKWLAHRELTNALGLASDTKAASGGVLVELASQSQKTAATTAGNAARTASDTTAQSGFLSRMATQIGSWLGLETGKTADTVTGNTTRASSDAATAAETIASAKLEAGTVIPAETAIAAMGAASAVASIPIVGPAMAVAAAADMSAMGAGYLALASAAGGWDRVPQDGALAELHKDEMVLPASLASGVRNMTNLAGSGGQQGGDTFNLYHSPTVNGAGGGQMSRSDFQGMLRTHSDELMHFVKNAHRNGAFR